MPTNQDKTLQQKIHQFCSSKRMRCDLDNALDFTQRATARQHPNHPILSVEDMKTLRRIRRELEEMITKIQPTTGA